MHGDLCKTWCREMRILMPPIQTMASPTNCHIGNVCRTLWNLARGMLKWGIRLDNQSQDEILRTSDYIILCLPSLRVSDRNCIVEPGARLTKVCDVTIQRYRNSDAKIEGRKLHILQCMGSKLCVTFQRCPLKFHTKCLTHIPQNM